MRSHHPFTCLHRPRNSSSVCCFYVLNKMLALLTLHADSVLFLTTSMLTIATILYLPNHIAIICRRAYYYFAGDAELSRNMAAQLGGKVEEFAGAVVDVAVNTKVAVEEAAKGAVEGMGWS